MDTVVKVHSDIAPRGTFWHYSLGTSALVLIMNSSSGYYLCSSVSTWWCHSSRSAKNSSRSDSLKTISFPPSPARWRSTLAIIMSYGSITLNWTTGETVLSKTITWGSKMWISLSKSGSSWVEGDEDVCLVNCQTNVKKCLLYCFDIL